MRQTSRYSTQAELAARQERETYAVHESATAHLPSLLTPLWASSSRLADSLSQAESELVALIQAGVVRIRLEAGKAS